MNRDDRVAYIYYMLEEVKTRAFIYKFIEKIGITSKSTAERVIKKLDMNKQLFLAAYTPVKSDSKVVEEILGVKASKVSSEVKKESVLKDGDIIEHDSKRYKFVYTGKTGLSECDNCCLNCGSEHCICENKIDSESVQGYFIEAAETDTLEEIAAKNDELQKELHTSKNVIETLQKGIEELNETITESKINIAEVCKERDDKEEEIRVLSLELQKYKNDLNSVLDDRQKLECLLHDSIHNNDESKEFRDIIEKMIQLHTAKNKDYGDSFSQSYNEFGAVMSAIRINDKLNRFKTLIRQNSEVKTESVIDTLADLANYAVMTIMEIVKQERKNEA